ncbi:probable 4-coumarate--CoA ligase 3 [Stomoxys calcitrans]|uniref:probable 4-coumarate--CoA ligase 3 n=1 Tax=Stomoxys calcitrans TaxID=35570 RepID=UPI0027E29092|nr:probable 4-coumarate--CoA ligase 3 [Stomoxys calcitrans]
MSFSFTNTANNTSFDKGAKIWRGLQVKPDYGPQDSIAGIAIKAMLEHPNHIGQICHQSGKELRNIEIATKAIQIARHFERLQLKQCDIIGLCAANTENVAPLFFGALAAGLSISTLDSDYDKEGIKMVCSCTMPRMIFCDGVNYQRIREAFDECGLASSTVITLNDHVEGVPSILDFLEEKVKPEQYEGPILEKGVNQVAVIICTSGTTGFPKAVCMSHAALLECYNSTDFLNRRLFSFSSLNWLTGILALIHGTISRVTRISSEKPFSPEDFFEIIQQHKVNIFLAPPSQLALALTSNAIGESDLSSLDYIIMGGCAIPYALIEKFMKYAPQTIFYGGYATSETCCVIASGVCESSNAVGTIGPNVEIKIIDNDNGKLLGPNELGEICVRSRLPWAGYYKNPELTRAIYDSEGWIYTGDNGHINDEGKLFLSERKVDIRKYAGFHFSPSDIEKVIIELPQVADVCVVGIPEGVFGHLPAAAVIKRAESIIDEREIYQHVVNRMQNFEHLRGGVYFFESLPRTLTGKTLRRQVVEMCVELRQAKTANVFK